MKKFKNGEDGTFIRLLLHKLLKKSSVIQYEVAWREARIGETYKSDCSLERRPLRVNFIFINSTPNIIHLPRLLEVS